MLRVACMSTLRATGKFYLVEGADPGDVRAARSSWRRSLATSRGNESHSRQSRTHLSMPPFRIPTCAGAEKAEAPARGPRKQRRQQRFHSMVSAGVAVIMGKLAKGEAALAAKKQEAKGGAS